MVANIIILLLVAIVSVKAMDLLDRSQLRDNVRTELMRNGIYGHFEDEKFVCDKIYLP
jgi:hypothetical protein